MSISLLVVIIFFLILQFHWCQTNIKKGTIECKSPLTRYHLHQCLLILVHIVSRMVVQGHYSNYSPVARHFGLNASRRQSYQRQYESPNLSDKNIGASLKDTVNWCCETCGTQLKQTFSTYHRRDYENSTIKCLRKELLQQGVGEERKRRRDIIDGKSIARNNNFLPCCVHLTKR